jgi:hypothetical protein
MEITLTDSLTLAAVLALLMLGYANRRVATARAARGINQDHIKGDHHFKQDKTMLVLRDRLSLESGMLISSASGGVFAFVAAFCVVYQWNDLAKLAFGLGLLGGLVSLLQSVRESSIANRSHFSELDHTVSKDDPYYNTPSA